MRRIVFMAAVLLSLPAGVAQAVATDQPVARLSACDMAGANRSALFYARMSATPKSARVAVHFTLMERLGRGAEWTKVDLPDLRSWHRSDPGVKTFVYKQTVDNLRAGGAYRARIQYRWLAADGTAIETVTRETGVCRGLLPNLQVGGLEVQPGPTSETRSYRVTVLDTGKGDADDIEVLLSVDGAVLDTATLDHLAPGESRVVTFTGPVCSKGVWVRLDPNNTIGESQKSDNSRLFGC